MRKYKKSIILIMAFIISMIISYGLGQNLPEIFNNNKQLNELDVSGLKDKYIFIDNYDSLEKIGYKNTTENPWGGTIAKIDEENIGKAILLTPDTGIVATVEIPENGVLHFEYNLFEGVGGNSDGAELNIIVSEKSGKEIANEKYDVSMTQKFLKKNIDLNKYKGQNLEIKFLCSNGKNNNSTCDWVILKNTKLIGGKKENITEQDTYVKSVHYFSDEWPINFWNSELDSLEMDLKKIREDGFDSIILVIPWREFQPTMEPISYNEYTFDKLDKIMKVAKKENLNVYVRIGYTWDYYNDQDDNITNRFYQLMGDEKVLDAWMDYVKTMYDTLSLYDNFKGGFLTWEDFWNNLGVCDSAGGKPEKVDVAKYIGYQDYIKKNYTIENYNNEYNETFDNFDSIYIPSREQPAMKAFYEFYDDFLNEILTKSQMVFPNLSMEVRMDWDVVYDKNGNQDYAKHESTFLCGNSDFTATMYGIPMGSANKGERISYKEALEKTEYILGNLYKQTNGKKIYVEQFIFADNTPAFAKNAQIKQGELNDYLENVSDVLLSKTWGYGIWTYRDYRANMLYNSQFALDLEGWNHSDGVTVEKYNNSNVVVLNSNGYIKQNIPEIRNHFKADEYTFSCDAISDNESTISVKVGEQLQTITINGCQSIELKFAAADRYDLEITANSDIKLDNIRIYSQIQNGFLYDENGNELDCISGIRRLNNQLKLVN